jgi:hypothetical protein
MGSFSNYAELKILDHIVGKTSFTMPTNIYLALSTADPTDDGSGIAEPVGNNYSRKQTVGADWAAASGGAITSAADLSFAEASGSWGTITHFAAFDAASGGNMLFHGALAAMKPIGSGDTFKFAAGDIDATLD